MSDESEPISNPTPIVLNFGGEGEVVGAINVNDMTGVIHPKRFPKPDDVVIVADIRHVPLPDGSVDEIIGNRMPWLSTEAWAGAVCVEAFRLLKSGGVVRMFATMGGATVCVDWLTNAGFQDVQIVGRHAKGIRP